MRLGRRGRGWAIRRALPWVLAIAMVTVFVPGGIALTDASPPAPPTVLVADRVDEEAVRVAWMPPAEDGGSEVETYHVYRAQDPTGPFTLVGSTDNATFEDRDASVEMGPFWYEVTAENQHGESAHTAPARETEDGGCIVISPNHVPPFHIDTGHCPGPEDIRQELDELLEELPSGVLESRLGILCHSWPGQVRSPVGC